MNLGIRNLAVLAALTCAPFGAAQTPARDALRPNVRRISLFKNGIAYLELEVRLTTNQPWVEVDLPAPPLHGSLTVGSDPTRLVIEEIVAERTAAREERAASSVLDLLLANVGRELVLQANDEEIRGRLIAFPRMPKPPAGPDPWSGRPAVPPPPSAELSVPGNLILVSTEDGTRALNPAAVSQIGFPGDQEVRTRFERDVERDVVRVRVSEADPGDSFTLHYLVRGFAWAPSYDVQLGGEGDAARIRARTDLVNDAFDLEDAPAHLVSGFPNLKFRHVSSPLALSTSLEGFIAELSREPAESSSGDRAQTQSVYSNVRFGGEGGLSPTEGGGFEGVAAEDLFFTELGGVTLKAGARSSFPLFEAEVPAEEIFRWEIPDFLDEYGAYRYRNQERPPTEVWHSLRITNSTGSPWTTAPVTVRKDGLILGQDICHYTPAGGRTIVKVTKALDIHAEDDEREIAREREATTLYGRSYDRITLEGTLYLCNYKDHAVTVEVSKTLSGEIEGTPEGSEVERLGRGLLQINPVNRIRWRLELPAQEEVRLTYRYEALALR